MAAELYHKELAGDLSTSGVSQRPPDYRCLEYNLLGCFFTSGKLKSLLQYSTG